jgi:hypothetical protein
MSIQVKYIATPIRLEFAKDGQKQVLLMWGA